MNENKIKKGKLLQTDWRGNTLTAFTGLCALLNLWGLQNTKGKKKTYVANEVGKVIRIYEGNGNGFPIVRKESEIPDDLYLTEV